MLVAWTTTPWTLPSNVALCVNADFEYVKIHDLTKDCYYILLESLIKSLYKKPKDAKYKIVERIKGKDREGSKYKPLFPYFASQYEKTGFRVISDDYVTSDSGVPVSFTTHQPSVRTITTSVWLMESSPRIWQLPNPVDDLGKFTSDVPDFAGIYVKDADKLIIKHLTATGNLLYATQIRHSYPFCWRILIPHCCTSRFLPGLSVSRRSCHSFWTPSCSPTGFQTLLRRRDSVIGSPMPVIGTSLETDTGVLQPLYGSLRTSKKLSALVP